MNQLSTTKDISRIVLQINHMEEEIKRLQAFPCNSRDTLLMVGALDALKALLGFIDETFENRKGVEK